MAFLRISNILVGVFSICCSTEISARALDIWRWYRDYENQDQEPIQTNRKKFTATKNFEISGSNRMVQKFYHRIVYHFWGNMNFIQNFEFYSVISSICVLLSSHAFTFCGTYTQFHCCRAVNLQKRNRLNMKLLVPNLFIRHSQKSLVTRSNIVKLKITKKLRRPSTIFYSLFCYSWSSKHLANMWFSSVNKKLGFERRL